MTHLPHGDRAILDIRKIEDYCLNPTHPRGRHKARVFRETLGVDRTHAVWLRDVLLEAVRESEAVDLASDALGSRWRVDCTSIRDLLGRVMATRKRANRREASLLDVVALLADIPAEGLARGQVGTVVELLDERTVLVEFGDDEGRAYAILPCPRPELLVLHYVPQAA